MTLNILIPIYEGINTLDLNGPLDVLCNAAIRPAKSADHPPFSVTIAAQEKQVNTYEFATIQPDINFYDALTGIKNGQFDILLVPGCAPGPDSRLLKKADGKWGAEPQILEVIRTFIATDNRGSQKWATSVCTGALFLGAAGGFKGLNATTHWGALGELQDICDAYNVPPREIIPRGARWVDGGYQKPVGSSTKKTRILSSGGISCGLDSALYLVEQVLGRPSALSVANVMDYAWREQGVGP